MPPASSSKAQQIKLAQYKAPIWAYVAHYRLTLPRLKWPMPFQLASYSDLNLYVQGLEQNW